MRTISHQWPLVLPLMISPFDGLMNIRIGYCWCNQWCCFRPDSDVLLTHVIAMPVCLSRIGLLDSIQNMVVESIQATAQRICQDEDLLLSLYQMDTSADSGSHKGAQQHHWGAADNNDDDGDSSSGDDNDGEEQHHRNQYQNQPAGKKSMDAQNSPFRKQCSIAMEDLEFGEEVRIRLLLGLFLLLLRADDDSSACASRLCIESRQYAWGSKQPVAVLLLCSLAGEALAPHTWRNGRETRSL